MKIVITLFVLIINLFVIQAQTINGKILNSLTDEPIDLATIQIDKDNGTVSNIDGVFSITLAKNSKTKSLIISCIGYVSKTVSLKDWKETIYLEESIVEIEEINISAEKLSAEDIIEKVKENYATNYSNWNNTTHKIFKRSQNISRVSKLDLDIDKSKNYDKKLIERLNFTLDSVKKPFLNNADKSYQDLLFTYYQKDEKNKKASIDQVTLLSNPDDNFSMDKVGEQFLGVFKKLYADKVFKVKISLFKVEDSLKMPDEKELKEPKMSPINAAYGPEYLYKNMVEEENDLIDEILNDRKYEYTILNTLYFKDELVYEIEFNPKKGSSKYKGKFYVSDESFAILKLDFQMLEGKTLKSVNLKLIGLKFKSYDWNGTIIYHKVDDKYTPQYIKQSKKVYTYTRIPVKFIENTKEKNRLKFKLKTLMESTNTNTQEYLFIKTTDLDNTKFEALKTDEKQDVPIKMIKKYDPSIWKKFNVIAPTYKILEFE